MAQLKATKTATAKTSLTSEELTTKRKVEEYLEGLNESQKLTDKSKRTCGEKKKVVVSSLLLTVSSSDSERFGIPIKALLSKNPRFIAAQELAAKQQKENNDTSSECQVLTKAEPEVKPQKLMKRSKRTRGRKKFAIPTPSTQSSLSDLEPFGIPMEVLSPSNKFVDVGLLDGAKQLKESNDTSKECQVLSNTVLDPVNTLQTEPLTEEVNHLEHPCKIYCRKQLKLLTEIFLDFITDIESGNPDLFNEVQVQENFLKIANILEKHVHI